MAQHGTAVCENGPRTVPVPSACGVFADPGSGNSEELAAAISAIRMIFDIVAT